MLREMRGIPGDAESTKHLKISIRVRLKRIEQGAIPVKQNRAKRLLRQHEIIVADGLA